MITGENNMKKVSLFCLMGVMTINAAHAGQNSRFRDEVLRGVDVVVARETAYTAPAAAPGELGLEVYQTTDAVESSDIKLFIPTTMYMRAGAGLNLNFATDSAKFAGKKHESNNSYSTQIALGWNLSSYVRTELDFQESTFKFKDVDDRDATYQTVGGMLYFDLARRYVMTGDVTRRRVLVPFFGLGAGLGYYQFAGTGGADGFVWAAPRASVGLNIMLTDLIGIDIAYQYQMMIGNGFGWDVRRGGVDNVSNIMASMRVNF